MSSQLWFYGCEALVMLGLINNIKWQSIKKEFGNLEAFYIIQ
jgi:hypothetical protein